MLRFHTLRSTEPVTVENFQNGDDVFLAKGSYQGTVGTFVKFKHDSRWADILEQNSQVRSHPVAWLQHSHRD